MMRRLLDSEQFSPIAPVLNDAANSIRSFEGTVMLLAAPSLVGALSVVPIEAALIESGIKYRRRFRMESPNIGSWIHVLGPGNEDGPKFSSSPPQLSLSGMVVEGLRGSSGDIRRGPLTTVAQAHALAQLISPNCVRLRKLRPWLISGNWMHSALDTTYDPVFTKLRDTLENEGTATIVPLPEVISPEIMTTPWIEEIALEAVSSRWEKLDLEGRARALSHLMRPILSQSKPSTARMEELGWHRVLGIGWEVDLASQILQASRLWKAMPAGEAAHVLADSLLQTGQVPSLES